MRTMAVKSPGSEFLNGRSAIMGASGWMFGISFLLTLLLSWIPFVGPFIGPIAGGYVGGRRAGTVGSAFVAAILPAVLMSLLIVGIGAVAAGASHAPVIGAIAVFIAGAMGLILVIHNVLLIGAALVGGLVSQGS